MSSEPTSLEDFQLEDGKPEGFDSAPDFVIRDEAGATWAMRKLATAQRRIREIERQAAVEHDRIERWETHATKSDQSTVDYFTEALGNYVKRLRQEDGRKSIALPDGTVKSREIKESFKVEDLDAFVKWVHESPDLESQWLRTKVEANVQAVKAGVFYSGGLVVDSATGETIDGLSHVEGSISVSVEVSE
jgi:phage host-nuclease inhibitor protein Gam